MKRAIGLSLAVAFAIGAVAAPAAAVKMEKVDVRHFPGHTADAIGVTDFQVRPGQDNLVAKCDRLDGNIINISKNAYLKGHEQD